MARRGCLIALALAAALAPAAPAPAQQARSEAVKDDDDARGTLDLARVALARNQDGRLRVELTLYDDWDAGDLVAAEDADAPVSLCADLWIRRDESAAPPDYRVCAAVARDGKTLLGRVLRERANGLPRHVADATVSRPTGRTVYLRFPQTPIGRPFTVRFAGELVEHGGKCPALTGCVDRAPEQPQVATLRLRSR